MIIQDTRTGELIHLETERLRLRRCQKRVKAWADLLQLYITNKDQYRLVMITLTYKPGRDWKPNDIREFMQAGRKMLEHRLLAYAWVAELQKRGAVHYHVLMLVTKGANLPVPDSSGWWPWGMSRIETAKSAFYILSYTGKKYQKIGKFPKGLRLFAVWVSFEGVGKNIYFALRSSAIPAWLALIVDSIGEAKYSRSPGGGWEVENLGIVRSPYKVVSIYG